ncbi:MAG: PGPGW domain-containing protein [Kineosporiaceae bacterium]
MTAAATPRITHAPGADGCADCADGLGKATEVEPGGLRDRIRTKPGLSQAWRVGVFVAGLLCIALGIALAVLPGPLTIPPVLLGLWVWSTEFDWAKRMFTTFRRKAADAWTHAKQHPVSSAVVTVGGLALVAAVVWAMAHFDLVDRGRELIGL